SVHLTRFKFKLTGLFHRANSPQQPRRAALPKPFLGAHDESLRCAVVRSACPPNPSSRDGRHHRIVHRQRARNCWIIGVCRASSSRKQSCPYGASITCSSTSRPLARSAAASSSEPDGG